MATSDHSALLVQFCPLPPCQTAPLHWVKFHVVLPSGPFSSICFLEMNKLLDTIKWGQSPWSKRKLFICKDSAEPGVYFPLPSAECTHTPSNEMSAFYTLSLARAGPCPVSHCMGIQEPTFSPYCLLFCPFPSHFLFGQVFNYTPLPVQKNIPQIN